MILKATEFSPFLDPKGNRINADFRLKISRRELHFDWASLCFCIPELHDPSQSALMRFHGAKNKVRKNRQYGKCDVGKKTRHFKVI